MAESRDLPIPGSITLKNGNAAECIAVPAVHSAFPKNIALNRAPALVGQGSVELPAALGARLKPPGGSSLRRSVQQLC